MERQQLTFVANVVGGGQITIPTEVRRALFIQEGTTLEVTVKIVDIRKPTKTVR